MTLFVHSTAVSRSVGVAVGSGFDPRRGLRLPLSRCSKVYLPSLAANFPVFCGERIPTPVLA